jgi:xanthine dehydrogenase YagR molybdenum-binding subunit
VSASNIVPGGIGADVPRIDGRKKVTGEARYASDHELANLAYAFAATSSIALGRVRRIHEDEARRVPGVLDIFTHHNVGHEVKPGKTSLDKGYMGCSIAPLYDDKVHYAGQIVALVVAETFEAAREAAQRLRIEYKEKTPSATLGSPGVQIKPAKVTGGRPTSSAVGDANAAYAQAPVKIDAWYQTPTQHHNPLELFSATCSWAGDHLTVWEGSQNVRAFQHGLAKQLKLWPSKIRVISPFIGGAFGSRGSLNQYTALVAFAARRLKRPVKLVLTRGQGFTNATFRAETRQHVQLAATRDGRLQALIHDGWELTSRADAYAVAGIESSTRLYACPNIRASACNVRADRHTPGFMRAPPETPYLFALESAMDELAYELAMDPVELRRINDTQHEPIKGLPFTSRALMRCFDEASHAFGWAKRDPQPGSMRDGEWLLGWGCASALYPTQMAAATARVRLERNGSVTVQTGTHEIGTGAYTILAQTAVEHLGVSIEQVRVELGDSRLPPAPLTAGSSSAASVCSAVAKACEAIRKRLARAAVAAQDSPLHGIDPSVLRLHEAALVAPNGVREALGRVVDRVGVVEEDGENTPHGVPPFIGVKLLLPRGIPTLKGGADFKDRVQYAFGAQFVEVRVHARTREVRVSRVVGAYAFGRILNPRTAKSQLMGAQIWGIAAALHEATEIDRRSARYYNDDLAEYLIAVNADIPEIEAIMIPEHDDQVNALGIKGVGELGNVGMNAAVANAVFHATGKRVRELPIRPEKLL